MSHTGLYDNLDQPIINDNVDGDSASQIYKDSNIIQPIENNEENFTNTIAESTQSKELISSPLSPSSSLIQNINNNKEKESFVVNENLKLPPKFLKKQNKIVIKKSSLPPSNKYNQQANTESTASNTLQHTSTSSQSSSQSSLNNASIHYDDDDEEEILDEYNPFQPNDYTQFKKQQDIKQQERVKRELESNINVNKKRERPSSPNNTQRSSSNTDKPFNPLYDDSGEAAYERRQKMSKLPPPSTTTTTTKSSTSEPISNVSSKPTKILLLTNIAQRGEIDDALKEDIQKECERFGMVNKIVYHFIVNNITSSDDSNTEVSSQDDTRIFIYFEEIESAHQAYMQLNNRFFAKRQVQAYYYIEKLFFKNKLDP